MIQRFLVPNPAAGHDWTFTVPGEYNATILSVTAQLLATANPTTSPDQSGNLHDATYETWPNVTTTYGAVGPFGGSSNLAVTQRPSLLTKAVVAIAPNGGQYDLATFTYEAIINVRNGGLYNFASIVGIQSTLTGNDKSFMAYLLNSPNSNLAYFYQGNNVGGLAASFSNGAWHHVALTYDGTTWRSYIDGVATGTSTTGTPDAAVTLQPLSLGGNNVSGSNGFDGSIAAAAVYSGALPAANIANHAAAIATSSAAYVAACNVDTPIGLWLFSQLQSHFQRTAILEVSDGTNTLAAWPGFAPSQQSNLFTWTWSTDASSSAQTPGQTVTFVPITPTTLPPGYKLFTVTPDLTTLDQWQNVVVWADIADSGGPGGPGGAGAPGAYLDATIYPDGWKVA